MKVSFCETVEVEGSATIGIDEIQSALCHAVINANADVHNAHASKRDKQFTISEFANSLFQCLEAIEDETIQVASDGLRKAFSASLQKHADRWSIRIKE